jgi:ubiquinol-cytochrome c reductase cytochrome c1 subunit
MLKKIALGAAALTLLAAGAAWAATGGFPLKKVNWSFGGPFGTYDRASAQRGFQVYKEVCAACHGLSLLAYRDLQALGLSENAVKALAADVTVMDGPNKTGEMFERPARPSDRFKKPYPNEEAARAANNKAYPPDLSLMAKARVGGPDYIYSLLTGYADFSKLTPEEKAKLPEDMRAAGFKLTEGMNFNLYFPGHQIAMAEPLKDDQVTYADGTKATKDQMVKDVSTFLAWAAEPKMEERKKTGVRVVIFLLILAGLLYATKRKVWSNAH